MKDVKKETYDSLIEFLINDTVPPSIVQVNEEITLLIYPSKPIQGRIFRLMGSTDEDAGGAVIQMYVDNIRHCLSEKNSKVESHKSKYKDWWLFLVDHIVGI